MACERRLSVFQVVRCAKIEREATSTRYSNRQMQFFGGGTMASASRTGRPISVQHPEQRKRDDGGSKGGGKTYCRSSRGLGGRADCAVRCVTTLTVYGRIGKGKEGRKGAASYGPGRSISINRDQGSVTNHGHREHIRCDKLAAGRSRDGWGKLVSGRTSASVSFTPVQTVVAAVKLSTAHGGLARVTTAGIIVDKLVCG